MRALHRITVAPAVPEPLAALERLAGNLRSTWDRDCVALFETIDRQRWHAVGRNPVRLLQAVPRERLLELAEDEAFLGRLRAANGDLDRYLADQRWYAALGGAPGAIAYFSPEFGVSEALPQYSGGLGVLAGDHLKAASDLGVPIFGVGLFYRYGYFQQDISANGMQQEHYPVLNPDELPMQLVSDPSGSGPLRVSLQLPGTLLHAQVWRVAVGRVTLLLLDSDVPENAPSERAVTDRLYGGNTEHRLRQEILLGVGGVRALHALGIRPDVFHTNEGHAGFLGLERVRLLLQEQGLGRAEAIEAVRTGTVFTTHTPVPAGIDRFPRHLIEQYFGPGGLDTGLSVDDVFALGAEPGGDGGTFNMAVMGLRLAERSNGVSRLHGEVSRRMFAGLWPGLDPEEVPIAHVTNGVHAGTWITRDCAALYDRYLGPDDGGERNWAAASDIRDDELWAARGELRRRLVDEIRTRLRASWTPYGPSERQLGWINRAFDPEVLTIGFARRVPSYKRLTLILRDRERLERLLLHPDRPVQIVVAGKSHPADEMGKHLIQQFVEVSREPRLRHRMVFLPDYDMGMAKRLVSGADVWLNNPLRPYEACGTSGMKAALNGVLNLSIRDGWWDELYDGGNGWAIPSADDGTLDPDQRDAFESAAIFDLLENEVVPLFYERIDGLPLGWIAMVKRSLAGLGPALSASRMVRDYVERLYLPAARSAREVAENGYERARRLAEAKRRISSLWPKVAIRDVSLPDGAGEFVAGGRVEVQARVQLGELRPDDVEVQVAYGRLDEAGVLESPAFLPLSAVNGGGGADHVFAGTVPLVTAGQFGYTARVVPRLDGRPAASELGLAAWAHAG